jgi:hypothetical protein
MRSLILLALLPSVAFGQGITLTTPNGVAPPRTNYAPYSNGLGNGNIPTNPPYWYWASTIATIAGAPQGVGGGSWIEITGAGGGGLNGTHATPAAARFVVSMWMSQTAGTPGDTMLSLRCPAGSASTCTCYTNGVPCSANIAGDCQVRPTNSGASILRVAAAATCSAGTAPQIIIQALGTTVVKVAGLQLEVGVTQPSKLCVTPTTAARTCRN